VSPKLAIAVERDLAAKRTTNPFHTTTATARPDVALSTI